MGDKRSVIALKHNVKFAYENGKLTPPAKGEALWKAIEPPHSGPGLSIEDAIPFVEDVPPAKRTERKPAPLSESNEVGGESPKGRLKLIRWG